jgi:hypothetical protein
LFNLFYVPNQVDHLTAGADQLENKAWICLITFFDPTPMEMHSGVRWFFCKNT